MVKIFQIHFKLTLQSLFTGEANVRVGTSFDNKTDQWLGASLAANDGNILVKENIH
jgi:hypothetical protein